MARLDSIHLPIAVAEVQGYWHQRNLYTLNSTHSLKIAQIKDSFIWHSHPETDELFYVVSGGPMQLELETTATSPEEAEQRGADQVLELKIGDIFVVPKGMQHRPSSKGGPTGILLIEKVGTSNVGDQEGKSEIQTRVVD